MNYPLNVSTFWVYCQNVSRLKYLGGGIKCNSIVILIILVYTKSTPTIKNILFCYLYSESNMLCVKVHYFIIRALVKNIMKYSS